MSCQELRSGDQALALPVFFPAVSSVKDEHSLGLHLELLSMLGAQTALTSAYDWARIPEDDMERSRALYFAWAGSGAMMLLDSGRYESYWHRDTTWLHEDYVRMARELVPPFVMTYDSPTGTQTADEQAAEAEHDFERDQSALPASVVIPIVHGSDVTLPAAVSRVARGCGPRMIAVAERELGDGVLARCGTIKRIRDALSRDGIVVPLHVLGAGSPMSVLLYVISGAQSFDGLEWNRTVVDMTTGRLHHSQHFDFFQTQAGIPSEGSYWGRVLTHNLVFWQKWMRKIRAGDADSMIQEYVLPVAGEGLLVPRPDAA